MDLMLTNKQWECKTPVERRTALERFEVACLEQEQTPVPIKHHYANGVYAREAYIPAGVALVGKIHKYEHLNIVSKGKIRVATEDGIKIIEAPATFVSPAGTKRAGYVLEDTVWTTLHATSQTDAQEIERAVIANNYSELDKFLEQK